MVERWGTGKADMNRGGHSSSFLSCLLRAGPAGGLVGALRTLM